MILDYHLSLELCLRCLALVVPPPGLQLIANEEKYLPMLHRELNTHWPTVSTKSVFAAQVQQETCSSLKSKKCWSPTAELKTSREYGFGLGQITITSKFNNFTEARKLDRSLKDWVWENRYNPEYQLRTMVLSDKFNYGKFTWAGGEHDRLAFSFAAYNGGIGGVLSDRAICRTVSGCDQSRWFGHVEHTSNKARVSQKGYGQGFFQINRAYVKNIMVVRRARYKLYFGEE